MSAKVFFRHPSKGWVYGDIVEVESVNSEEGVICREEGTDSLMRISEDDVAVARHDIDVMPADVSELNALHPGTLIRCIKKRYDAGSAFTLSGPRLLFHIHTQPSTTTTQITLSDLRKASLYYLPHLYPSYPELAKLAEPPNKGLLEPLGWWTHAKKAYATAMTTGHSAVVCLGETVHTGWWHRLRSQRMRKIETEEAIAEMRLGATNVRMPVHEDHFDCDLDYNTGAHPICSVSNQLELTLSRLGTSGWSSSPTTLIVNNTQKLTSLLADLQTVLSVFFATPERSMFSKHTKICFCGEEGGTLGFLSRVFWTGRGTLAVRESSLNCFKLLAHSRTRQQYLRHHQDKKWGTDVVYIASGEAFLDIQHLFKRIGLGEEQIDAIWRIVSSCMLLDTLKVEEISHRTGANILSSSDKVLDEISSLLGTHSENLRRLIAAKKRTRTELEHLLHSLSETILEAAVQWIVAQFNIRSNALVVKRRENIPTTPLTTVDVITVPGLSVSKNDVGTTGDLCHNLCLDALYGYYDSANFDTAISEAVRENGIIDPLLEQLKGRSVLDKINPILKIVSRLDTSDAHPGTNQSRHECTHSSGEHLRYDLVTGFIGSELLPEIITTTSPVGKIVSSLRKYRGTLAQEGIAAMSELLKAANTKEKETCFWLVSSYPFKNVVETDVSGGYKKRKDSIDGIILESSLYASRIVESSLLCKVGYSTRMTLREFCCRYKPIVFPAQIMGSFGRVAHTIARSVFGGTGNTINSWDGLIQLNLSEIPDAPPPVHIGPTLVLLTTPAITRLDAVLRYTTGKLSVLVQVFSRAALPLQRHKISKKILLIQRYCRAAQSRNVVYNRKVGLAIEGIAFELLSCLGRRRNWRRANNLEASPLGYRQLQQLLSSQQRDRRIFFDAAMSQHCDYGFEQSEVCISDFQESKEILQYSVDNTAVRTVTNDEQALRIYLEECSSAEYNYIITQTHLPVQLQVSEKQQRNSIRIESNNQMYDYLFSYGLYFRERIELGEVIERMLLHTDNMFLQRNQAEASHRHNIVHSESRCRDLIYKEFSACMVSLGGLSGQHESRHRREIIRQEALGRFLIYSMTVGSVESVGRIHFENRVFDWFKSVQYGPSGLQITELHERNLIFKNQTTTFTVLKKSFLRSEEAAIRLLITQNYNKYMYFGSLLLNVAHSEFIKRSDIEVEEFQARSFPQEYSTRCSLLALQKFSRFYFEERFYLELQEITSWIGLLSTFGENEKIMTSLRSEYDMLLSEKERVRQYLTASKPILPHHKFSANDFLVPQRNHSLSVTDAISHFPSDSHSTKGVISCGQCGFLLLQKNSNCPRCATPTDHQTSQELVSCSRCLFRQPQQNSICTKCSNTMPNHDMKTCNKCGAPITGQHCSTCGNDENQIMRTSQSQVLITCGRCSYRQTERNSICVKCSASMSEPTGTQCYRCGTVTTGPYCVTCGNEDRLRRSPEGSAASPFGLNVTRAGNTSGYTIQQSSSCTEEGSDDDDDDDLAYGGAFHSFSGGVRQPSTQSRDGGSSQPFRTSSRMSADEITHPDIILRNHRGELLEGPHVRGISGPSTSIGFQVPQNSMSSFHRNPEVLPPGKQKSQSPRRMLSAAFRPPSESDTTPGVGREVSSSPMHRSKTDSLGTPNYGDFVKQQDKQYSSLYPLDGISNVDTVPDVIRFKDLQHDDADDQFIMRDSEPPSANPLERAQSALELIKKQERSGFVPEFKYLKNPPLAPPTSTVAVPTDNKYDLNAVPDPFSVVAGSRDDNITELTGPFPSNQIPSGNSGERDSVGRHNSYSPLSHPSHLKPLPPRPASALAAASNTMDASLLHLKHLRGPQQQQQHQQQHQQQSNPPSGTSSGPVHPPPQVSPLSVLSSTARARVAQPLTKYSMGDLFGNSK